MKKKLLLLVGIIMLLAVAGYLLWPVVDSYLMKTTMTNAVAALSNADEKALTACFTADARLLMAQSEFPVPIKTVIRNTIPMLKYAKQDMPSIVFQGFNNMQRQGNQARAGFTVLVQVYDKPVVTHGVVALRRMGIFSWKISEIGIYDLSKDMIMGE